MTVRRRIGIASLAGMLLLTAGAPSWAGGKYLPPVTDPVTQKACGECHMAFPPGLLPARSWAVLLDDLSDHFGEDASLPADQAAHIKTYLMTHAGDAPGGQGLREFMRWVAPTGTPQRITENPAFLREHDFPDRVWQDPKVVTKSNCLACHAGAAQGWFDGD